MVSYYHTDYQALGFLILIIVRTGRESDKFLYIRMKYTKEIDDQRKSQAGEHVCEVAHIAYQVPGTTTAISAYNTTLHHHAYSAHLTGTSDLDTRVTRSAQKRFGTHRAPRPPTPPANYVENIKHLFFLTLDRIAGAKPRGIKIARCKKSLGRNNRSATSPNTSHHLYIIPAAVGTWPAPYASTNHSSGQQQKQLQQLAGASQDCLLCFRAEKPTNKTEKNEMLRKNQTNIKS